MAKIVAPAPSPSSMAISIVDMSLLPNTPSIFYLTRGVTIIGRGNRINTDDVRLPPQTLQFEYDHDTVSVRGLSSECPALLTKRGGDNRGSNPVTLLPTVAPEVMQADDVITLLHGRFVLSILANHHQRLHVNQRMRDQTSVHDGPAPPVPYPHQYTPYAPYYPPSAPYPHYQQSPPPPPSGGYFPYSPYPYGYSQSTQPQEELLQGLLTRDDFTMFICKLFPSLSMENVTRQLPQSFQGHTLVSLTKVFLDATHKAAEEERVKSLREAELAQGLTRDQVIALIGKLFPTMSISDISTKIPPSLRGCSLDSLIKPFLDQAFALAIKFASSSKDASPPPPLPHGTANSPFPNRPVPTPKLPLPSIPLDARVNNRKPAATAAPPYTPTPTPTPAAGSGHPSPSSASHTSAPGASSSPPGQQPVSRRGVTDASGSGEMSKAAEPPMEEPELVSGLTRDEIISFISEMIPTIDIDDVIRQLPRSFKGHTLESLIKPFMNMDGAPQWVEIEVVNPKDTHRVAVDVISPIPGFRDTMTRRMPLQQQKVTTSLAPENKQWGTNQLGRSRVWSRAQVIELESKEPLGQSVAGNRSAAIGKDALELTNKVRAEHGRKPLEWNQALCDIARKHSQDMAEAKVPFGHDGFDKRADQLPMDFTAVAENVQSSHGLPNPAKVAVDGWVNSPGHRRNLLGPFTLCGIGVYRSAASGAWYLTQLFVMT